MNYLNSKLQPKSGYGFIYRYVSPSGKSYIGQTTRSLFERAQHNGKEYKNCTVFYNAIQKYGWDNFKAEILEECLSSELDEKEKSYIEKYNSLVPNGYNVRIGGNDEYYHRKLARKEIDVYDIECNYLMSFSSMKEASEYYKIPWQVVSQCARGVISYYKNWIFVYKGVSPAFPIITKTQGRITAQYSLVGNLLQLFPSANAAARAIGKNSNAGRNIRQVCEGKRNKAYGYIWKYLD